MSIARNCPYSDSEENCRYEIFAWQPRLNKCSTCERFLKKRFPDIDTSRYNIDENGNVLRDKGRMTDNTKTLYNALDKIKELEKEKCELLGIIQGKDKVIQELEKENAKLKKQVENRNCSNCRLNKTGCPNDGSCHNFSLWRPFINPKLTKAKEIIKDYMIIAKGAHITECGVPEENRTIYVLQLNEEAEQFIKE